MSGIKVVSLVVAIVSAFTDAAILCKKRRKALALKLAASLENSFVVDPPRMQSEYDADIARIGPRFAQGDDYPSSIFLLIQS